MPRITVSKVLSPENVVEEVQDRLLGRRPDIEKRLAMEIAAELVKKGAISFVYAKDYAVGRQRVTASVVYGQEVMHRYQEQPMEVKWEP